MLNEENLIKAIKESTGKTLKIKYTNFDNMCIFSVGRKKCQIGITDYMTFIRDTNNIHISICQLSYFTKKIIDTLELKVINEKGNES